MPQPRQKHEIGSILRKLREGKSLTQAEAGDLIGAHGNTIGKWEMGYSMPDAVELSALCVLYGVSSDFLIFSDSDLTVMQATRLLAGRYILDLEKLAAIQAASSKKEVPKLAQAQKRVLPLTLFKFPDQVEVLDVEAFEVKIASIYGRAAKYAPELFEDEVPTAKKK